MRRSRDDVITSLMSVVPWHVARERRASLAQLVEQCFRKAEVPGSIPGTGST